MQVSILDSLEIPDEGGSAQALRNAVELARLGEELRLPRYWLTEHHGFPTELCPAPDVLAGAVAAATSRIRVGVGGMLLNRHSPYRIAQSFRTLAALYPGRIDLGIGRSAPGINAEQLFSRDVGAAPYDHAERLNELLHWLSLRIPEGDPFGGLRILPDQPAGPTPWLLAASTATGELAARLGLQLASSGFHNPEITAEIARGYQASFRPSAFAAGVAQPACLVAVMAVAAETQEEAEHLAMPMRMLLDLRQHQRVSLPAMPSLDEAIAHFGGIVPAEQEDWPRRVVGSFVQVAEMLRRMADRAGVDEVMIRPFTTDVAARHAIFRRIAPLVD